MYDARIGKWISQDPMGFRAGDINLYRYAANAFTDQIDPSGLQNGVNNHCYPLHLGGSANQPVVELASQAAHVAFHRYFNDAGFGYGEAGRAAWARLTRFEQARHIIRAMRAAGVPGSVIRTNLRTIMRGATPGVLTPRPSGFPGGVIRITSVGVGALAEIFLNPGVASAAEIAPGWRRLPGEISGTAVWREMVVTIDHPRAWNLFGNFHVVAGTMMSERGDLGMMTVEEARQLEGLLDSWEVTNSIACEPPPFGYWRECRIYSIIEFEPYTGRGYSSQTAPMPP
jgi:hypothetical protein